MGYELIRMALIPPPQMRRICLALERLSWTPGRVGISPTMIQATRPDYLELAVCVNHAWDDENERHEIADAGFSGVPSEAQIDFRLEQRRESMRCLLRNLREAGGL